MPPNRPVTVLIVEDRKSFRAVLREFLALKFPDCKLLEAATGARALQQFDQHQPRLVLMDIQLPDINGIEATRCIKARSPDTVVIAMSMMNEAHIADRALAAGATAFISKDHLFRDLEPLIRQFTDFGPDRPQTRP